MQLRADEIVRKVATQRNDSKVLAITTSDLIAKEACYHFTCYREYTRQKKIKERVQPENDQNEHQQEGTEQSNMPDVIKFLVELYEKPDVVLLSKLQDILLINSEKKNLKRNIENRTNHFKFTKYGQTYLVYPITLKFEDLVVKCYELKQKINHIEGLTSEQKIVTQAANIVKNEIKNSEYQMSWPPTTDELDMSNFINPPNLETFLVTLFNDGDQESNRVSRWKSSFGQDLAYTGRLLFIVIFLLENK